MGDKSKLNFIWYMHFKCDYRCPYCWFYGRWHDLARRNRYLSTEELANIFCGRIKDDHGCARINITGGEPFLYPNITELVSRIAFVHKVSIETNLSSSVDHFSKHVDYQRVEVIPVFHPLFVNLRTFMKQVLILKDRGFTERVRFLAYPRQIEAIPYYKSAFLKEELFFEIVPFWGRYKGKVYPNSYSPAQLKSIGLGPDISEREKFIACGFGKRQLVIMPDGTVSRCEGGNIKELGNIFEGSVKLPDHPGPLSCSPVFSPCNEEAVLFSQDKPDKRKRGKVLVTVPASKSVRQEAQFNRKESVPPRQVFFSWYINTECNYKCSYCKPSFHGKTLIMKPREWEMIWKDIYERYGTCSIHLSGGEPFLYPGFLELVECLSAMHTFEFSTNLSGDINSFTQRIDPARARVGCSLHPEAVDIKRFLKKVLMLRDCGFGVWVNYVGYPSFLGQIQEYKEQFAGIGVPFHVLPYNGQFRDREFPRDYTPEELSVMNPGECSDVDKKAIDWRTEEGKNSMKGQLCRMGQMYARIYPDGTVLRCCADKASSLGNLADKTFFLHESPQPCDSDNCPCWRCMLVGKERHWVQHWVSLA